MRIRGLDGLSLQHPSYWTRRSGGVGRMSDSDSSHNIRPLTRWMRWLLYAASLLVFLAGPQLTLFSEQTDTYFAWKINPPITAAFLGAAYWAAVPVEVIAARQRSWAEARVAVPAIWLFTPLPLVVTLVPL